MLPSNYCKQDAKWLNEQLRKLPYALRSSVAGQYSKVYKETYDAEPVAHQKESSARFEANTRLRAYIEKVV